MSGNETNPLLPWRQENTRPIFHSIIFGALCVSFLLTVLYTWSSTGPVDGDRTHVERISVCTLSENGAQVQVKEGRLQGKWMRARNGREFLAFYGVPYAKPPIGHLRFMPPEDPDPWTGIRDATINLPQCPSLDTKFTPPILKGREDCLNLNVYTSKVPLDTNDVLFPVMLYIHGGGHGYGTGQRYSPDYFMEENVVLITLDYRTGPLGTLSLNTPDASGNQGLKDQAKALQWVKNNIRQFGGDPDKVTLFGNSGGAFQVSAHMLSPLSKGLFQRIILQSGTILFPGVLSTAPEQDARDLAVLSNCPLNSTQETLRCLKTVQVDTLISNALSLPNQLSFTFCVDSGSAPNDIFLPDSPIQLLEKNDSLEEVPVIIGVTSGEALFESLTMFTDPEAVRFQGDALNVTETLVQDFHLGLSARDPIALACTISDFYLPNGIKNFSTEIFWNVTNMFSDRMYVHPAHVISRKQFKRNLGQELPKEIRGSRWRKEVKKKGVFIYYFTHPVDASHVEDLKALVNYEGVKDAPAHGDELQFLFPMDYRFPPITPDHKYINFSRSFVKLWTNFADIGIPTPAGVGNTDSWLPIGRTQFQAFELNENPKMVDFVPERMKFWNQFNLTELYR